MGFNFCAILMFSLVFCQTFSYFIFVKLQAKKVNLIVYVWVLNFVPFSLVSIYIHKELGGPYSQLLDVVQLYRHLCVDLDCTMT